MRDMRGMPVPIDDIARCSANDLHDVAPSENSENSELQHQPASAHSIFILTIKQACKPAANGLIVFTLLLTLSVFGSTKAGAVQTLSSPGTSSLPCTIRFHGIRSPIHRARASGRKILLEGQNMEHVPSPVLLCLRGGMRDYENDDGSEEDPDYEPGVTVWTCFS